MNQPKLNCIDTPEGVEKLRLYLQNFDYITFDIETTGVTTADEIIGYSVCASEQESYYVMLSKYNPKTKALEYLKTKHSSTELIRSLQNKSLIMHNGVFDCMMTEAFFKVSLIESLHTDTMILAHLLNENRRVALKELAADMYGESEKLQQAAMEKSVATNGGLLTEKQYEMWKADGYLMAEYGAKDAWLTYRIFQDLVPQLFDQNLDKFFYEDESMPMLRTATYQLNTGGVKVDTKALSELSKTLEAEMAEAKSFIYSEIAPLIKDKYPGTKKNNTFNIGSRPQLSWLVFGELGLEFKTLTDGGKKVAEYLIGKTPYKISDKKNFIKACLEHKGEDYTAPGISKKGKATKPKKIKDPWSYIKCDNKILPKHADKYKWIAKLLEYQKKSTLRSTYVLGILDRVRYGVIYPSFLQIGTTSGRYSSKNPNFQNMPRRDKRIKACMVARPGKILVGADFSQLEPRVFAYMSQDKRLMDAFNSDLDFYAVIGMRVYAKDDCTPHKDGTNDAFGVKYEALRDNTKIIALAATYGASARQLSETTRKSEEDTQEDIDTYFKEFPGVHKMMIDSHKLAIKDGQVVSLFGRPRRLPEAKDIPKIYGANKKHADLPYNARNTLNLAMNHRIQSTGASIVNRAMIAMIQMFKDADINAKLVNQVHDSIIVECNESDAENVAIILQHCMENTTLLPGVPLQAVPLIGKSFAEV